jgi:hypothetical protein
MRPPEPYEWLIGRSISEALRDPRVKELRQRPISLRIARLAHGIESFEGGAFVLDGLAWSERRFRETGNTLFAWAALHLLSYLRQSRPDLVPRDLPDGKLPPWLLEYFEGCARRLLTPGMGQKRVPEALRLKRPGKTGAANPFRDIARELGAFAEGAPESPQVWRLAYALEVYFRRKDGATRVDAQEGAARLYGVGHMTVRRAWETQQPEIDRLRRLAGEMLTARRDELTASGIDAEGVEGLINAVGFPDPIRVAFLNNRVSFSALLIESPTS